MKKLITLIVLFLMLINYNAQTKMWLSGLYSDGNITYFNNGKPTNVALYWENGDSNENKNVVVYGNFEVDEAGVDYFYVINSTPQVTMYSGNAVKQKFACVVNSDEGKLTINDRGNKIDFVSFVPFQNQAKISVTKADWGIKMCNNNRYSIYYIQEINGNSSTNTTPSTPRTPVKPNNGSSVTSTGSQVTPIEAEAALAFHNKARADVNVEPLSWSPQLSEYAQNWANYLVTTGNCKLQHRPSSGEWKGIYGENIAMLMPQKNAALESSSMWYSEISKFQNVILNSSNWAAAGHYSQMVWRNTKSVGIGAAKCTNGYYIVVANYNPAGNFMGQKAY